MNADQYCGEYAKETPTGLITFSKKVVDKFIITYTNLNPEDFTDQMRTKLKITVMIDCYNRGSSTMYGNSTTGFYPPLPIEKIELPDFIFK